MIVGSNPTSPVTDREICEFGRVSKTITTKQGRLTTKEKYNISIIREHLNQRRRNEKNRGTSKSV